MAKQLIFTEQQKLIAGVDKLARAVRITLGPRGRNVILDKSFGSPTVTKDGVTIAREIEFGDKYENLGAQMVREVAQKTSDAVGDGTTTATILAEAIFNEGLKRITAGANPMALKRGIERAVEAVVAALSKMAIPLKSATDLERVATLAAGGDAEIGRLIATAMTKAGAEGFVLVEESRSDATTLTAVPATQFDKGYISPYFITDQENMRSVFNDVFVLLIDGKLSAIKEFLPLLEVFAKSQNPLLVIAEDIESEALSTLVVNKIRGILQVCAVKAPGYGTRRTAALEDLALLTGAPRPLTPALLKQIVEEPRAQVHFQFDHSVKPQEAQNIMQYFHDKAQRAGGTVWAEYPPGTTPLGEPDGLSFLGRCKKAIIDKDNTTLFEGAGSPETVHKRCEMIESEMKRTTSDYDREKLAERFAKLRSEAVFIRVGAESESQAKERVRRAEDALHATRAALDEGVVPGGGVAYLRAQEAIDRLKLDGDERLGAELVRRSLERPLRQIATNAGADEVEVVRRVRELKGNHGYDAAEDRYLDMVRAGIIDPAKVVRSALQNAASVATLLLTTETLVADLKPSSSRDASAEMY
jgi:chaperonin GroEL